jgi:hypothetical protein
LVPWLLVAACGQDDAGTSTDAGLHADGATDGGSDTASTDGGHGDAEFDAFDGATDAVDGAVLDGPIEDVAGSDALDDATKEAGDAAVADSPVEDSNDGSSSDASEGGPDAGDPIDVAVAALPASCSPLPTDKPACSAGAAYDHLTGHCVDGQDALGPFPQYLRDACAARGGGSACATDVWNRDFLLLLQDTSGLVDRTLDEVLAEIKRRPWVYCQPHAQDLEGNGIHQVLGQLVNGRSEDIYPPFVLAPRRQTDSLVRALYLTLPLSFRAEHAFVIADRLMQNPEAHARYVRSRGGTTIAGSFVGIGTSTTLAEWAAARHADEMWKLRTSITLVHALGRSVDDVVYAMGDSSTSFGLSVRQQLQARMHRILDAAGLGTADKALGWGADETATIALSRHLPTWDVRVTVENPEAKHHYDGMRATSEILAEKLPVLRLNDVGDATVPTEFEVVILTRRPGGAANDYQANDTAQASLDDSFLAPFKAYDANGRRRLAIVDARIFNGAWDKRSALPHCDYLAFGSWGTFGNVLGSTLAAARIMNAYGTDAVRRQLYLEAVAHDVFANGYAEAQRGDLRSMVEAQLGAGTWSHWAGYTDEATTVAVFDILNGLVSTKMQSHFAGSGCVDNRSFRFTPQLWRTFESEVHLWDAAAGEVFAPGVYRTDLPADTFDPTQGRPERLSLQDLIDEAL